MLIIPRISRIFVEQVLSIEFQCNSARSAGDIIYCFNMLKKTIATLSLILLIVIVPVALAYQTSSVTAEAYVEANLRATTDVNS